VTSTPSFIHALFVKVFFGFVDDFYTQVCSALLNIVSLPLFNIASLSHQVVQLNETAVAVNVQSFSRAGTNDFGSIP